MEPYCKVLQMSLETKRLCLKTYWAPYLDSVSMCIKKTTMPKYDV